MAFVALVILIQNIKETLHLDPYIIHVKKEHTKFLEEEASFLLSFVKDSQEKAYDPEMLKELNTRIRNVAGRATDYLDSREYIWKMRQARTPQSEAGWILISMIAYQCFDQIIEEIKSIKSKILQATENKFPRIEVVAPVHDLPSMPPDLEEKLVGIDNDVEVLLDQLTGGTHRRQVIPIIGMGGIGKTTLAQRIYYDSYTIYHFDIRAWINISQGLTVSVAYQVRAMLLGLLECFITLTDDIRKKENSELGEQLYKILIGTRYLIVLDDMWSTKAWSTLNLFFPDDENGSRIMFTSRVFDVSLCTSTTSYKYQMHFLGDSEAWELLESKLFSKGRCPIELVGTGKRIASRCQGLPLVVVVVAGLLNKVAKTWENWSKIANDVDALVTKNPEQCIDILGLSYNYLPNFLKACFLYMGAFPRDTDIPASKLIWLWIAEGFIIPVASKRLEDIAAEYLDDLVSRNLVLVRKRRWNGKIKTCHIHDLLHDLCVRESEKENFLLTIKRYESASLRDGAHQIRVSLHGSALNYSYSARMMPFARSFLCFDINKIIPEFFLLEFMDQMEFKLLRVLDIMVLRSNHFPIEIVDLVHLRYLALAINCVLPGSISKLKKLQTLIIDHIWEGQYLPQEIWMMPQLRHVHVKSGLYFPLPSSSRDIGASSQMALKNLQTLSTLIGPLCCSKEVFARLPNLRKLEIYGTESDSEMEWHSECLSNLVFLNKLETLKCSFQYRPRKHRLPQWNVFSENLRKMSLSGSYFPWDDMAELGKLPNLQVLKLRNYAFDGDLWRTDRDGFHKLKLLLIENSDPMNWDAESSHFPNLQHLVLLECQRLIEIPQGIGKISSLEIIELHACSVCLVDSAIGLREQQLMFGNELDIRIT